MYVSEVRATTEQARPHCFCLCKEVRKIEIDLDKLLQENAEYEQFMEKFKPKLTTDDCYTPENIYQAVKEWVFDNYQLAEDTPVVRPFWPGADYKAQEYPDGCVVIDNPPFSILAKIERYYLERGIRFFLFAPALTCFKSQRELHYVFVDQSIVYNNGANVATSFVTNMGRWMIQSAPDLDARLKVINEHNKKGKPKLPVYDYPMQLLTASSVRKLAKYGVAFCLDEVDCMFVRSIDNAKAQGKEVYGGGFLISEHAAAEHAAAEKENVIVWELSEREKELVRRLGRER